VETAERLRVEHSSRRVGDHLDGLGLAEAVPIQRIESDLVRVAIAKLNIY
jgi:hypothetical protein